LVTVAVYTASITGDDVQILLFDGSQCSDGPAVAGYFLPIRPGRDFIAGFSKLIAQHQAELTRAG
jgi:hypothetical protein